MYLCSHRSAARLEWPAAGKPAAAEHNGGGKSPRGQIRRFSLPKHSSRFACPMSSSQVPRKAVTPDYGRQKSTQEKSKVTKPRPRAMSHGAQKPDSGDGDVQVSKISCSVKGHLIMEMEDVASAENRKPRTSMTEARGPTNPINTTRSLPGSSQALSLGYIIKPTREASPPPISESASQRPETQVSDVPFRRPTEKKHPRISKLERDNQELRDELQKLRGRLSSVQSTNARQHDSELAAGLADSANKIAKLEDALANEKSQAADKISALTLEVATIAQLPNVNSGLETKWTNSLRDLLQAQRGKRTLSDQIHQKDQSIAYLMNKYNQERVAKEAKEKEVCVFSKQYQSLAISCANKDKTIKQQKLDIAASRNAAEHHLEELKKAVAENEKLRAHIEQQEMSVTKAQNAAMNVLSRSLSAALPDDRVRTRFKELFESIAEWARDNATEDRTMLDDIDSKLQWQKHGIFRYVGELGARPNLEFDFGDETAIDTLLNTALARRFCQDFLKNPFWFAEDSSPIVNVNLPKAERIDTDLAMGRLLKKMMSRKFPNDRTRTFSKLTRLDRLRGPRGAGSCLARSDCRDTSWLAIREREDPKRV
jgi:hypothetical protein